jgi:hypothetical protein
VELKGTHALTAKEIAIVMLIVLVLSYVNRGVDMPKSVDVKVLVALRMSSQKMYV